MRSSVRILRCLTDFPITILVLWLSISKLHVLQLATNANISCLRHLILLFWLLFGHLCYLCVIRRLGRLLDRICWYWRFLAREWGLLCSRLVDRIGSGFQLLARLSPCWLGYARFSGRTVLLEAVVYDESWFVDIHLSRGCLLLRRIASQRLLRLVVHLWVHRLSTFRGQVLLLYHAAQQRRLGDLQQLRLRLHLRHLWAHLRMRTYLVTAGRSYFRLWKLRRRSRLRRKLRLVSLLFPQLGLRLLLLPLNIDYLVILCKESFLNLVVCGGRLRPSQTCVVLYCFISLWFL